MLSSDCKVLNFLSNLPELVISFVSGLTKRCKSVMSQDLHHISYVSGFTSYQLYLGIDKIRVKFWDFQNISSTFGLTNYPLCLGIDKTSVL